MKQKQGNNSYHHEDLRGSLLNAANQILKEGGIENISLRKLADKVNASRTAPYHYFKNKNELLCVIAEDGFIHQQLLSDKVISRQDISPKEKYRLLIHSYIKFAVDNPELYDLMYGRIIWKKKSATQSLRDIAYENFKQNLDNTRYFQEQGLLPINENTLSLHKVRWATMHGLAKLLTDGIYANHDQIDEMCECTVNLFIRD